MKKLVILIGIVLLFVSADDSQIKFSNYVKGNWMSYSACIVATETTPTTPGATVAYNIDNYHFNISVTKFLWIKRYVLKSSGEEAIYSLRKDKFTIVDVPNSGKDGEVIGKITLSDLQMPTGECNCLLNPSITTEYIVVTYNLANIMIWIPYPIDTVSVDYTDIYLRTIYWSRPNYVYSVLSPSNPPSDKNPVIIANGNEKIEIKMSQLKQFSK